MRFQFRKSAATALTSVLAVSTILSASAASTTKALSSNFTLVNLVDGTNNGQIQYVLPNGQPWRTTPSAEDQFTLTGLGAQAERRQYFDTALPSGSGSVVVSTDGPVGAVVQIQAREDTPTSGAYIGVSQGATEVSVPLVMRHRNTAGGAANSQVIVQNASSTPIDVEVTFFDGVSNALLPAATKTFQLQPNAANELDLENEVPELGENWFGSAVVRSTTAGGEVAVVTNLFNGPNALQTFNGFTNFSTKWGVPLLASRLANGLSTPLVIQNRSGQEIPINGITVTCTQGNGSPGPATFQVRNGTAIPDKGAFFNFNPVTATDVNANGFPPAWFGPCTVDTGSFNTALFIQMRVVGKEGEGNYRAGAYEGINMNGTNKKIVIPLYARRLANGFVSNVTIQNLSTTATANITLAYVGNSALTNPSPAQCTVTYTRAIPPNGAQLENHRIPNGVPNATPDIPEKCYGTLTVTSDQPIDAFVQLDQLDDLSPPPAGRQSGDRFMAHNAFGLAQ